MKFVILFVLSFALLIPVSVFAEIQHNDEINFSINVPEEWILESPKGKFDWAIIKTIEKFDPYPPFISVNYHLNTNKIGTSSNTIMEYVSDQGIIFNLFEMYPPEVWCNSFWKYQPYSYADEMNCVSIDNYEEQSYEINGNNVKRIDADLRWESDWKSDGHVNIEKFTSLNISNGIEIWKIVASYDSNVLLKEPEIEKQIEDILLSFTPSLCKEKSNSIISITGEKNPVINQEYTYNFSLTDTMDDGRSYYAVLGQDYRTFSNEKTPNSAIADTGDFRGNNQRFSQSIDIVFRNISYNEGYSEIIVTNGCLQEKFPIKIWESTPILDETTPKIPTWIKNNVQWWADGQVDDATFTQGIGFLIKEKIVSITDLPKQSSNTIEEKVPDWIKNNAKWWADGQIDDESFVTGIKYLVEKGIIRVN
ncbi:MAG: hypothetical protein ISR80_05420 [Nitrosopumilus sp.]|nr:hypothetical protein [Nitrosopumilus sp.]